MTRVSHIISYINEDNKDVETIPLSVLRIQNNHRHFSSDEIKHTWYWMCELEMVITKVLT